jgi:hypothetical protein
VAILFVLIQGCNVKDCGGITLIRILYLVYEFEILNTKTPYYIITVFIGIEITKKSRGNLVVKAS